jgi:hypothetical protein
MAGGIRKATKPAVAALALVAFGAGKVVDLASTLNEAQSAVTVTFGKSADQMIEWSKATDDAMSQAQFLGAAKQFGTFGKAAGLAGDDLNGFSKDLIDAANDMASFHDVPIDQALEDLRSGLAGEVEPLRKYGILLNDAALRQEAMRQGLIKNTKEALSPQNKTLAAQALIMKGLGPAAGDWKRTMDSAANTERRQAANTEDLNAKLGKGLLPAYQVLQRILLTVTGFMGEHTKGVQVATGVIVALASAILVARGAMALYVGIQKLAAIFTTATNATLIAQRALMALTIVGAIILIAAALVMLWKKSETFRAIVTGVWNAVKASVLAFTNFFTKTLPAAFNSVLGWVRRNWKKIAVFISGPFAPLVLLATDAFGIRSKLTGALSKLLGAAKSKAKAIGRGIRDGLIGAASGIVGALRDLMRRALNGLIGLWNRLRVPGFSVDPLGKLGPTIHWGGIDFPNIPTLHSGGMVPGVPGQEVLTLLEAGEEVLPRSGRGPRRNVVVNQYFTEPPDDPFPWLRKSQFAAEAVYGG